jgi:hypothetical protein
VIFQKSILALLFASGVGAIGALAAGPHALAVWRHWDLESGSARQLRLERSSTLVSTGMALLLTVQSVALLLFVFNADRMASQFVGAMCAVGTLRVDGFGFPALLAQVVAFFGSSVWLTLNAVDGQCRDRPLTRARSALLLALIPVLLLAFGLELAYFLELEANVITSCCGSLFTNRAPGLGGDLAAWPPGQAMPVTFVVLACAAAVAARVARRGQGGVTLGTAGILAFAVSLAGIVAFVSLYVYEAPHHHCPFCLLEKEYGYRGYAFYVPLFAATSASLAAAALAPFAPARAQGPPSAERVRHATRALAVVALGGFVLVLVLMAWQIVSSPLKLFPHE